ncbi:OsmC family protein [Natronolimnohabitans sp. A-GB9]|uniref:OsmC family protein n=1 Tax=Natronolimnohabitans sp. A-GB9 TaxID=3069757 RepID=UPI0027B5F2C6|nr:OsmC family protein [Natronolimnohabitans sp. A-GB9]MDQ2050385.1 OsmC family protein [Natronolimnohabitans sp. A-GB9]
MATTDKRMVNGVDVSALEEAIEAIDDDPAVGSFTFKAATEWTDALKAETVIDEFDQAGETIRTREFTLEGDEPEQILGERTAPNAVETLLGALGSCLTVGYAAHAAAMGIDLESLHVEMAGDVDLRGFLGIDDDDDVRPGYESIECTVAIDADADESQLRALRDRVESTSPLMDVITNEVPIATHLVLE